MRPLGALFIPLKQGILLMIESERNGILENDGESVDFSAFSVILFPWRFFLLLHDTALWIPAMYHKVVRSSRHDGNA